VPKRAPIWPRLSCVYLRTNARISLVSVRSPAMLPRATTIDRSYCAIDSSCVSSRTCAVEKDPERVERQQIDCMYHCAASQPTSTSECCQQDRLIEIDGRIDCLPPISSSRSHPHPSSMPFDRCSSRCALHFAWRRSGTHTFAPRTTIITRTSCSCRGSARLLALVPACVCALVTTEGLACYAASGSLHDPLRCTSSGC